MGATMYLYRVYDTAEDEMILQDVPLSKVVDLLKVHKSHVSRYADEGQLIHKRYRISREIPSFKVPKKITNYNLMTASLYKQWTDVYNAAEALKDGSGKLVKRRQGQRYVKYVEVR